MKKISLFCLIISGLIFTSSPTLAGSGYIYNSGYGQTASWSSTSTSISVSHLGNQWGWIAGRFCIPNISPEVEVYAGAYWKSPSSNYPYVLASNLVPNQSYTIYCNYIGWRISSDSDGSEYNINCTAVTDCIPPLAPVYSSIKHDRVNITIDRGANSLAHPLRYMVYQGTSSAGPWTLVHEGTSSEQNYTFTKTGLVEDTTYYFYVEATGGSGVTATSPKSSVMTSSDPTLAAVEAAKGAAEAASQQVSAVKNTVDAIQLDIIELRNIVNELRASEKKAPEIIDAHFFNRKSITSLDTETVYITVSDEEDLLENLRVRAITNNIPGEWEAFSGTINVHLSQLLNTVIIQVANDSGKITSSKPLTIWKK